MEERIATYVDRNAANITELDKRVTRLEDAMLTIKSTLKDLRYPPRWIQTGLLLTLVLKDIAWPILAALWAMR